jgi:hypothetical protein
MGFALLRQTIDAVRERGNPDLRLKILITMRDARIALQAEIRDSAAQRFPRGSCSKLSFRGPPPSSGPPASGAPSWKLLHAQLGLSPTAPWPRKYATSDSTSTTLPVSSRRAGSTTDNMAKSSRQALAQGAQSDFDNLFGARQGERIVSAGFKMLAHDRITVRPQVRRTSPWRDG